MEYECTDVVRTLSEYKGKNGENKLLVERVDNVCDIIVMMSDDEMNKIDSLINLIRKIERNELSRIDNVTEELFVVLDDLKVWLKNNLSPLKQKAIRSMRKKKKSKAIAVVVILSIIAGAALSLGILSAFEIINSVWCNIIGVFDCVFGLSFFIYEYSDDKLRSSEIAAINENDIEGGKIKPLVINHGIQSSGWFTKNVQISKDRH